MKWDNLMKFLQENPAPESDPEYDKAEQQYLEVFGHMPSTASIPDCYTKEQILDAMNQCVALGNDNILEILGVDASGSFLE